MTRLRLSIAFPLVLFALTPACASSSEPEPSEDGDPSSGGANDPQGPGSGGTSSATGGGDSSGGASAGSGGALTDGEFSGMTSAELITSLGLGWNLGNSLDAPEGETAWGNPTVTQELFRAVGDAGFDLVRIPVTWSMNTGDGPDFTIEPAFLERVEQVVGYAQAEGLYAIINLHHDGADEYAGVEWLTLNDAEGAVTPENNDAVRARFVALWTQIAAHFQDHGEGLLFESMNEIHDGYDAPDPAYYDIINDLNQQFVDVVRASGGKNAERHLVVPGYNTNIDYTLAGFVAPSDPTENRLILSVHFYDPWNFAGAATTNTWGAASPGNDGWGQEDWVTGQFDKLKTAFIDTGLPMILGEYGAVHQTGYEDYRRYYMEYVTKAAKDRTILPVVWDNGSQGSGNEAFGLFNRDTNEVLHSAVMEAMVRAESSDYSLNDVALPTP